MTSPNLLIKADGQPNLGVFNTPVDDINYLDYDFRSSMDRKLSVLHKRLKFNQFQFIGLTNDTFIAGLAIVDLKIASHAFLYLFHLDTHTLEEFSFTQPFSRNTRIETQPNNGESYFHHGNNHLTIKATSLPGIRRVQASLGKDIEIDATIDEATAYKPLAICTRAGYQGWVFTQKNAALVCNGHIQWRGQSYDLAALKTLGAVDWTAGYMRRETFWNWGNLSCLLPDGRRFGMNISAGVNETGFTENAIWIDGQMFKIDMVDFKFDRYHPSHAWAMTSNDGIIRLHFDPKGKRQEKRNLIIAASNFTQYFGQYHGEIQLPNEAIHLNGVWGFTEDHYAKW